MTRLRVTGTGPPLLLISGLTRDLEAWDHLTRCIQGRTVITYDAPGIDGTPARVMTIRSLAEYAAKVLDEAGVESADVLGFSHGGAVAQQLAHSHPGRVNRLILAGTMCGLGGVLGDIRALAAMRQPGTDWWAAHYRTMALTVWSSLPFLGRLTQPTLVVVGERDRVCPVANSRILADRIPDAQLVTVDAGHDLQDEEVALELAWHVQTFLKESTETEEKAS
jgi:pimeloyl-ACP methyl ester carboxylesterase